MNSPKYREHEGTVKVAGATIPDKAASCAFACLMRDRDLIEFLCIGANANQQATKAMWSFRQSVLNSPQLPKGTDVAFVPFRVAVQIGDKEKDATAWRVLLLQHDQIPSIQGGSGS